MQTGAKFAALREKLDGDGKKALATLLAMPFDEGHPVYGVLYRARNKAAFHFDRGDFATALRRMLGRYGSDATSTFLFEPHPGGGDRGRMYYSLADELALEISYGLPGPNQSALDHDALRAAIDLHRALGAFVQSALITYCSMRGLRAEIFRPATED